MKNELANPTFEEKWFFETYGYLILENFLSIDHVIRLKQKLLESIDKRITQGSGHLFKKEYSEHLSPERRNDPSDPYTLVEGKNVRAFSILNDDPVFLELLDYSKIMPYIYHFLSKNPHFHASDAIWEKENQRNSPGWHRDGADDGYEQFLPNIPLLQLKIGYILSDMLEEDYGNLILVPASHNNTMVLNKEDPRLKEFNGLPGSIQICASAGTAILFHNALWHTSGYWGKGKSIERIMLYYAYEHNWMLANSEFMAYPKSFYDCLSEGQKLMFHGFANKF